MKNRSVILLLTIVISLLCLYNLSFTYVARNIEADATAQATDGNGKLNQAKKQDYLDSLWKLPVYNVLGIQHTFKEVKENELNLGLDLQGGVNMVLEVSPVEIIRVMAGRSQDANFLKALAKAQQDQKNSNDKFTTLFLRAYQEVEPDVKLSRIFANSANRGRISLTSSNNEVISVIDKELDDAVGRAYEIIQTRIDKFGTTSPNIQRLAGSNRIQVELPGVDNPERVRKLLSGEAKLEFVEVWDPNELGPYLEQLNTYLTAHADDPTIIAIAGKSDKKAAATSADLSSLSATTKDSTAASNDTTATKKDSTNLENQLAGADSAKGTKADSLNPQANLLSRLFVPLGNGLGSSVQDTSKVNRLLSLPDVQAIFPANMRFVWDVKPEVENQGKEYIALYTLKQGRNEKARLEGEVISDARQDFGQGGQPEVNMQMNSIGAKIWKRMTSDNIGKRIAIVLDNSVYSAPNVQGEIPNGNSSISGNFTIEEAKDLANILKAGKLPAPTRIVQEATVGPSLGQEAINQGLLSMLAGLGLIVVLMIGYYGSGGAIANVALFANVFFNIGVLAQLHSSLTLPGIAGIVLTIGMSVDANVLIYERIREELKNGVSMLKAIDLGFDKAYSSIIDGNVTTFIIGAVLYIYGSGSVKGFAITLMIGILCSLFAAIFITRLIVEGVARSKSASALSFDTVFSKNLFQNLRFDYVGNRKISYTISAVIIAVGLISLVLQGGLSLGVDFAGGRSYVVRFDQPVTASDARAAVTDDFQGTGTEVKTFGADNQLKITTSYLIDDESAEADDKVKQALMKGLSQYQAANPRIMSSDKVGATIADDITSTSRTSIILSLVLIFLYILVRFRKWQYSLGAIIALMHDVLMVICAFAIVRWFGVSFEVDQVFIAAILTIIGYSINDTVVIFDRIREFSTLEIRSKAELTKIINDGVNATLSRSIMTSLTVLVVVVVLLIFGGEVLRGFSFALLIGVISGSYSTIFIASPIVLDFATEKAPELVVAKPAK